MAAPDYIEISGLSKATGQGDLLKLRFTKKRKWIHNYKVVSVMVQMGLVGDGRLESVRLERVSDKGVCQDV